MIPFVAIFPGQGSQHAGMGRALVETFPEARAAFEEADAVLGRSLSSVCFEGTESDLARTETTQPAILTASVAALRVLEHRGARPVAVAGHSLGEYTAHVAASTVSFPDAVRIVRERGRFMQEAVPAGQGAMAAILGLDRARVEAVCRNSALDQIVSPANFNGPAQIVIAGHAAAVDRAVEAALAAGARKAVRLPVSAPFHCKLMEPAAARLSTVLHNVRFNDPMIPVYTNVDASPVSSGEASRDALVRQVAAPVRWQDEVEAMIGVGFDAFVEVGPGRVLAGLVRRISKSARVASMSDPGELADVLDLVEAA